MLQLNCELEGKKAYYGNVRDTCKEHGYVLGGNWDYDKGHFDTVLHRDGGETIYVRAPFQVLSGELDHHNAYIQFEKPYVIKHVVNVGLDRDGSSLIDATGFSQFQEPLDTDGYIRDKSRWEEAGHESINKMMQSVILYH